MTTTACDICTEKYNKKTRKCVTCKACNFRCCTMCLENYFETSKTSPQCMSCHKPWNHQYLSETIGASCLKRILEAKKELLFNEQKALFPHTQEYIKLCYEKEIEDNLIKKKNKEIQKLKGELNDLYLSRNRLSNQMHTFENNCLNPQTLTPVQKHIYIQACNKPDCKGYIDTKGLCGLCKTTYCKRCMVEKSENHICNENDVLSVEAIKKDSKACPTCSSMIHRISGCPDMFCTSCNTSFNWNTLKIDKNGNSNPLYYKWLREGTGLYEGTGLPSTSMNVNCDEQRYSINHVFRSLCFKNELSNLAKRYLSDCLQSLHHSSEIHRHNSHGSQNQFRTNTNFETMTLKYRKDFMTNKSSEKNFKTQLLKIQKQQEYNSNILHISNIIEDYRLDAIRRVVLSSNSQRFDIKEFIQSYIAFSEYINNCVNYISKLFYNHNNVVFIAIPNMDLEKVYTSIYFENTSKLKHKNIL